MASISLEPHQFSGSELMCKARSIPNKQFEVSMVGETVMITGANSGIGLACAHVLAKLRPTRIIFACRSIKKGEDAATPIREAYPSVMIEVWELDMLSYPSIRAFAQRCATLDRLDRAILNAGVSPGFVSKQSETGHEETIQAKREKSRPGRLTIVGSGTGLMGNFENRNAVPLLPSFDVPFSGITAANERYCVSKTLVMMLVHKLSQIVSADDVIINTVEPGLTSDTGLHRDYQGLGKMAMGVMKRLTSKTPEQAAWTYIDAVAVKGKESHGGYLMFWEVYPFHHMMYTDEGKQTTEQLWKETMVELDFAGARGILDSMRWTR